MKHFPEIPYRGVHETHDLAIRGAATVDDANKATFNQFRIETADLGVGMTNYQLADVTNHPDDRIVEASST
jgi:hypothetical protein